MNMHISLSLHYLILPVHNNEVIKYMAIIYRIHWLEKCHLYSVTSAIPTCVCMIAASVHKKVYQETEAVFILHCICIAVSSTPTTALW